MSERIPLFPLASVLYPGLMLPLHIFEERYRLLVRELIELPDGSRREFGVIAIKAGREVGRDGTHGLYEIGCTAVLRGITPYEDGRFDIVTSGGRRFSLLRVHTEAPYLQADVEWLAEDADAESSEPGHAELGSLGSATVPGEPDLGPRSSAAADSTESGVPDLPRLRDSVAHLFRRYQTIIADADPAVDLRPDRLPDEPHVLSYLVSAAMVLDLPDKQRLLAAPDVRARLRLLRQLLRRELMIVGRIRALPAVDLLRTPRAPN